MPSSLRDASRVPFPLNRGPTVFEYKGSPSLKNSVADLESATDTDIPLHVSLPEISLIGSEEPIFCKDEIAI
jgi:hypothetical protein